MDTDTVSPAIINNLHDNLQRQRQELTAALRERLHHTYDQQHMALFSTECDGDEQADATQFSETDIAMLNHELSELRAVDDALGRMHDGRYGICVHCGTEIQAARLQAQPDASMCLDCQVRAERQD